MEKLETKPLNEIITELSRLEQEINLKIQKYNLLASEVCRRFPTPEVEENFKMITKGEIKIWKNTCYIYCVGNFQAQY